MKQKKSAFSIIELLVVIVIIGILATLSVPMFTGYLVKAKDTHRQVFVRELHRLMLRNTVNQDTIDYRFGETTAVGIQSVLKNELLKIGYGVNDIRPQEGISYFYFVKTDDLTTTRADEFFSFTCKQAELGSTTGSVQDIAFVAGTVVPGSEVLPVGITDMNARAVCGQTPISIDNNSQVEAGWTVVEIVE